MTKTNEKKRRKNEKEAGSQSYLSADNKMEARQEAIEAQDGRRGIIEASRAEREAQGRGNVERAVLSGIARVVIPKLKARATPKLNINVAATRSWTDQLKNEPVSSWSSSWTELPKISNPIDPSIPRHNFIRPRSPSIIEAHFACFKLGNVWNAWFDENSGNRGLNEKPIESIATKLSRLTCALYLLWTTYNRISSIDRVCGSTSFRYRFSHSINQFKSFGDNLRLKSFVALSNLEVFFFSKISPTRYFESIFLTNFFNFFDINEIIRIQKLRFRNFFIN